MLLKIYLHLYLKKKKTPKKTKQNKHAKKRFSFSLLFLSLELSLSLLLQILLCLFFCTLVGPFTTSIPFPQCHGNTKTNKNNLPTLSQPNLRQKALFRQPIQSQTLPCSSIPLNKQVLWLHTAGMVMLAYSYVSATAFWLQRPDSALMICNCFWPPNLYRSGLPAVADMRL